MTSGVGVLADTAASVVPRTASRVAKSAFVPGYQPVMYLITDTASLNIDIGVLELRRTATVSRGCERYFVSTQ
jgi:hypothetical protein